MAGVLGRRVRLLTALLFVDIVGSTEIVARVGDDEWADLLARHKAAVLELVDDNGGWCASFTGDGFLAVFDLTGHALSCAVAVRTTLAELGLSVRSGIHFGEIDVVDDDVSGLNVHLAARIMAAARPGEILVSAAARRPLGDQGAAFRDRGEHDLRGITGAWQLYAADIVEDACSPMPLPTRTWPLPPSAGRDQQPLFGRGSELDLLHTAWDEVSTGAVRAVAIGGEPGAGKSRLVAELARAVHARGATVLWGSCEEGLAVPFQPFLEQLDFLVAHCRPGRLRRLLGAEAVELVRLLPSLEPRFPGLAEAVPSDPETERFRLFEAIRAVVSRLSMDAPLLLVFEDVHWATPSTLRLLRFLIQRLAEDPVLLVFTFRDTAPEYDSELVGWLATAGREAGFRRLGLKGLSPDAVESLLGAVPLPAGQRSVLATAIHARTDGNALFSTHLVRQMTEDAGSSALWPDPLRLVPRAAVELIAQRLSQLPGDSREVLMDAAVLGRRFDTEILAEMRSTAAWEVRLRLDPAVDAHLLREGARTTDYEFTHALVVDAIVSTMRKGRLGDTHVRAARAIEKAANVPLGLEVLAELCRHYRDAGFEPEKEMRYSRSAGEAALAARAYADAADFFAAAIAAAGRAAPDPLTATRIRLDLARAQAAAGRPEYRVTLEQVWTEAIDVADADLLAEAALAVARGNWSKTGEVDERRVAVLDAALAAKGWDDRTRVRLLSQLATELNWAVRARARREALVMDALALVGRLDDPDERMHVIGQCAAAIQHPDNVETTRAVLDDNEPALDMVRDPVIALQSCWTWVSLAGIEGDLPKMRRLAGRIDRISSEVLPPLARYVLTWARLGLLFLEDRFDDVLAECTSLVDLGTTLGLDEAEAISGFYLLLIGHLRGQDEDLLPLLEHFADVYRDGMPGLQAAVAMLQAGTGRSESALELLDCLAADEYWALRQDQSTILWLAFAAETARRLHATGHARALHQILLPYERQLAFNGGFAVGSVQHWLGVLAACDGRDEEALARLEAAARIEEEFGMRVWAHRSRVEHAAVRGRQGDRGAIEELRSLGRSATDAGHLLAAGDVDRALLDLTDPSVSTGSQSTGT